MKGLGAILHGSISHNQASAKGIDFGTAVCSKKAQTGFVGDTQNGIVGEVVTIIEVADFYRDAGCKAEVLGQVDLEALGGGHIGNLLILKRGYLSICCLMIERIATTFHKIVLQRP